MGEIGEKTMCKRGFQKASSVPWSRCALVVSFISNNHILQCIGKVDFHVSYNGEFSLSWMGGMGPNITAIGVAATELTAIH